MTLSNKHGGEPDRSDMKKWIRVLWLAVAMLLTCAPLFSQTANGRISGTVKDATGGAIVGAAVTVTDVARGLARNLTSDEAGIYSAPNLLPGTYTVRATFAGFQAWERTGIPVEVGADLAIDVLLQPGAQTQTVTVTEELPMVNTTSATLGGTIAPALMEELPSSGRNFMNLQQLQPGVVLNLGNDSNGGGAQNSNGLRNESSNEYLIEGLHVMDPYTGQSVINVIGVNGDAAVILPIDSIQEFSMQFNPKAEYGFRAGGSVGVGLKSGTNALHGTAFADFRATPLDARTFFNTTAQPAKSNGDMQQWGATIGGPIKKDKLFFFLGYEQQSYTYGFPASTTSGFTDPSLTAGTCSGAGASLTTCFGVPGAVGGLTVDPSNDLILACLAIPTASRSPQSLFIAGMQPDCTPNAAAGAGAAVAGVPSLQYPGYFAPHGASDHGAGLPGNPSITTYFTNAQVHTLALGSLAKIDYQHDAQNSFNGFFFKGYGTDDDCTACLKPIYNTEYVIRSTVGAGSWTYLPNSVMANSLRIGYAKLDLPDDSADSLTKVTAASLGIPTGVSTSLLDPCGCVNAGYPTISSTGWAYMGGRTNERQGPASSIEISDQMSYLRGKHSLKFGLDYIREHYNGGLYTNGHGTFTAVSPAGFFAGLNGLPGISSAATSATNTQATGTNNIGSSKATNGISTVAMLFGNPIITVSRPTTSLFIQDDYRIRPRLTLNLGVRWQYTGDLKEQNNLLGGFDPIRGMTQVGINTPRLFAPDGRAFSPRVGFAWDVRGNGKTVLRMGASEIFELVTIRTFLDNTVNVGSMPTGFVVGCAGAILPPVAGNNVAAGATSNCNGTLLTSGGTITTAVSTFSAGNNDLGIPTGPNAAPTAINWDGPATGTAASILPLGLTVPGNCNSNIFTAAPGVTTAQKGIPGGACNIEYVDPNFRTPYVASWNVSLEQAIRNNIVLTVAYVGNHGVKLIGQTNFNQAYPNIPGVGWNAVQTSGANVGQTLGQTCINQAAVNTGQNQNAIQGFCVPGSLDNTSGNNVATLPGFGPVTAKNFYTDSVLNARPFNAAFPYLQNIVAIRNRDTSNYDALQTSLSIRNYHGLSLQAAYTWAHALGIGTSNIAGSSGGNAYNNSYNYGPQPNDVRHHFTLGPSYSIPGPKGFGGLLSGWKLNGTFLYQTGQAITPFGTIDTTGVGGSRWDLSGGASGFVPALTGQGQTALGTQIYPQFYPGGYIAPTTTNNPRTGQPWNLATDLAINNPTCVADAASKATLLAFGCWIQGGSVGTPPALGTYGNMAPGMARGPHFWELDTNVSKTQKITERFSAEFRASFFNVLNHPTFSPDAIGATCTLASCTAGQITNTPAVAGSNTLLGNGGPRRMALGVELRF